MFDTRIKATNAKLAVIMEIPHDVKVVLIAARVRGRVPLYIFYRAIMNRELYDKPHM